MVSIRSIIRKCTDNFRTGNKPRFSYISVIGDVYKRQEEATLLPNLLMKYMEIRKEERKDWTRAGQNRGTSQDLKAVSEALSYLRQKGLSTVEDLEAFLESSGDVYKRQMSSSSQFFFNIFL